MLQWKPTLKICKSLGGQGWKFLKSLSVLVFSSSIFDTSHVSRKEFGKWRIPFHNLHQDQEKDLMGWNLNQNVNEIEVLLGVSSSLSLIPVFFL